MLAIFDYDVSPPLLKASKTLSDRVAATVCCLKYSNLHHFNALICHLIIVSVVLNVSVTSTIVACVC